MDIVTTPQPNPRMIAWAREESGWPVERVAKRLSVSVERMRAWETGGLAPTLRQLTELARYYQRSLGVFFQQAPPRTTPIAAEYRRLSGVQPGEESPVLRLAIRQMLERRDVALNLYDELDYDVAEFRLSARLTEEPRDVGERLRAATGVGWQQQASWPDASTAWREWRAALDDMGLLVFMFAGVSMEETRGLLLPRSPLPVIAVNTKEVPDARAYTAMHEVVHLMLTASHEEDVSLTDRHSTDQWAAIERLAESAASFALIGEAPLAERLRRHGVPTDIDAMRTAARAFRVTPYAFATRLLRSGYLAESEYRAWKSEWDAYVQGLPEPSGFASPVSKAIGRGGAAFSQLVLEAYDTNRITIVEAARYLNLRTDRFEDLRRRLVAGSVPGGGDD